MEGRGEWYRGGGFPLFSVETDVSKGCRVVSAEPGSVDLYLGQCIRESLESGQVNSGSSVHSVGRAKVVPHPPG